MPPRSFRRPLVAALRAACAVLLLGGAAGCDRVADVLSPGRPGLAPARLALAARLPALQAGVAELRVAASYDRTDGSAVPLGTQTIALTDARTQDVSVPIELGPCLNDALRRRPDGGPDGACVVRLTVALLLDARPVDEQTVGPLALQPGATAATPAPLTLHDVRVVRLDAPAGSVTLTDGSLRLEVGATAQLAAAPVDANGQAVLGRAARFVSATPAVATVGEQTGVVTGVAPGTARITASVGGRDTALTVTVVPRPQPVTVTLAGSGGGTIVSTPAGIECRLLAGQSQGTCTFTFPGDARVSLLAVPQAGSGFGGWGDVCAASGTATTCVVTADQARAVRATFTAQRTVTVGGEGGRGSITSSPAGIACTVATSGATSGATGACSAGFLDGVPVTLTATPTGDDRFVSWGGACAAATGASCTFVVGEGATGASARFASPQGLTVAPSGTGEGSVAGGGIACARRGDANTGTCVSVTPFGTVVALTATPEANSTFAGWTGACSGTGACTVTVDEARTVGAIFTRRQVALAVSLSGAGAGAVSVGDQRCALAAGEGSASCTLRVDVGRVLALTATPAAEAEFTGWSGACSASARAPGCTLTLAADGAVGATFVPGAVKVTITGGAGSTTGVGAVSSGDGRLACVVDGARTSGTCEATFAVGATVTLTAAPDPQNAFAAWSGVCAGSAGTRCTFVVREPVSVGARFVRQQATLTVGVSGSGAGTVTLNGAAFCTLAPGQGSTSCQRPVDAGLNVTLTLQPSAGSSATWGGPCANVAVTAPCTFAPTGTAASVPVSFALTGSVSVRPVAGFTGGGRVSSRDQRIDCAIAPLTGATSGTCDAVYPTGATVSLDLTSITMETFVGAWSGLCTSTTPTCTFTVPAAGGTASITLPEFVNLSLGWTGSGSVATAFADSAGRLQICNAVPGNFACTGSAPEGSTVTFTATSQFPGWFQGWADGCAAAGTAPVCTRTVPFRTPGSSSFTVAARFDYEAVVDVNGAGTISLQGRTGPGSACTNAGTGTTTCSLRSPTVSATFVPTPAPGNVLTSWGTIACFTLTPTCTVEVPGANGRISAAFQATARALISMNFNNSGSGTTTIAFADAATQLSRCFTVSTNGYSCSGDVPEGSVVTFTAVSAFPNGFLGWTGDCASAGTALVCTRTVPLRTASNPPYVVGAQYDFGVPLGVNGGAGTVTLQNPTAGTPATCANSGLGETLCTLRSPTSTVTLVATPAIGNVFVGWDAVACISGATTCTLDVGASGRTYATFQAQGPLGIEFIPDPAATGGGRVITSFGTCTLLPSQRSGACSEVAQVGSTRSYTVQPLAGSQFAGWGGPCAGQGTTCTLSPVTVGGSITARFDLTPTQVLTVEGINSVTPGTGTVTSTPGGINCGITGNAETGTCAGTFALNSNVSLTPTPAPGFVFSAWSGACTGSTVPCVVPMTGPQTVGALFLPGPVNLTLAFDPASSGWRNLSVSGQQIVCRSDPQIDGGAPLGNGCTGAPVTNGSSITVSAFGGGPDGPNSDFVGWTGSSPCTGVRSASCTFTVDGNTTVQARFGSLVFASVVINNAGTTNGVVTIESVRGTERFSVGGPNASVTNVRYFLGDSLTVTASTTAPNAFSFWSSGACETFESNPVCTVIVSNSGDFNAVFANAGVALRAPASTRALPPGRPTPVDGRATRRP